MHPSAFVAGATQSIVVAPPPRVGSTGAPSWRRVRSRPLRGHVRREIFGFLQPRARCSLSFRIIHERRNLANPFLSFEAIELERSETEKQDANARSWEAFIADETRGSVA
jgi:hypothetical protein